jgi:hypothetical protein
MNTIQFATILRSRVDEEIYLMNLNWKSVEDNLGEKLRDGG